MKKLGLVLGCASFLSLAQAASAQEAATTTATKKAIPASELLENLNSRVEVRHGMAVTQVKGETETRQPRFEIRPIIGTGLVDNKLRTEFIFGVKKFNEKSNFDQRATENDTFLTLYKNDYVLVEPYSEIFLPFKDSGTTGNVNFFTEGYSPKLVSPVGTFRVIGSIDGEVRVNARSEKAPVERTTSRDLPGYGLTKTPDGQDEIDQTEPSTETEYTAGVEYVPSLLRDLTVEARTFLTREFRAKYEEKDYVDGSRAEKVGYQTRSTTANRLRLVYKVSDRLTLINDTFARTDGWYGARKNNTDADIGAGLAAYENVARVSYNLF